MSPPKRSASSFGGGGAGGKASAAPAGPAGKKPQAARAKEPPKPAAAPFIAALAELLRSRNPEAPPGLLEAPPEAYAGQTEAVVQTMARLKDEDPETRAGKAAGWGRRPAE